MAEAEMTDKVKDTEGQEGSLEVAKEAEQPEENPGKEEKGEPKQVEEQPSDPLKDENVSPGDGQNSNMDEETNTEQGVSSEQTEIKEDEVGAKDGIVSQEGGVVQDSDESHAKDSSADTNKESNVADGVAVEQQEEESTLKEEASDPVEESHSEAVEASSIVSKSNNEEESSNDNVMPSKEDSQAVKPNGDSPVGGESNAVEGVSLPQSDEKEERSMESDKNGTDAGNQENAEIKEEEGNAADVAKEGENTPADAAKEGEDTPADVAKEGEDTPADVAKEGEDTPADVAKEGEECSADMTTKEENASSAGVNVVNGDIEQNITEEVKQETPEADGSHAAQEENPVQEHSTDDALGQVGSEKAVSEEAQEGVAVGNAESNQEVGDKAIDIQSSSDSSQVTESETKATINLPVDNASAEDPKTSTSVVKESEEHSDAIDSKLLVKDNARVSELEEKIGELSLKEKESTEKCINLENQLYTLKLELEEKTAAANAKDPSVAAGILARQVKEGKESETILRQRLEEKERDLEGADRKIKDLQLRLKRFTKDDQAKDERLRHMEKEFKDLSEKLKSLEEMVDSNANNIALDTASGKKKEDLKPRQTASQKNSKTCIIL